MLGDLLINNVWLSTGVVALLVTSGHILMFVSGKREAEGNSHFVMQEQIPPLRQFASRFISTLLTTCFGVWLWGTLLEEKPQVFAFVLGAVLMVHARINMMMLKDLVHTACARRPGAVRGRMEYSSWFTHRLLAADLFTFAGFHLLAFFLSSSAFFLGGAGVSLYLGFRGLQKAAKNPPSLSEPDYQPESE